MASQNLADRVEILAPTGLMPLLTTTQLMARYGVSNWTVNEWVKRGCPIEPTVFRGRRFDLAKVERWMTAEAPIDEAVLDRAVAAAGSDPAAPPAPEFIPSRRKRTA